MNKEIVTKILNEVDDSLELKNGKVLVEIPNTYGTVKIIIDEDNKGMFIQLIGTKLYSYANKIYIDEDYISEINSIKCIIDKQSKKYEYVIDKVRNYFNDNKDDYDYIDIINDYDTYVHFFKNTSNGNIVCCSPIISIPEELTYNIVKINPIDSAYSISDSYYVDNNNDDEEFSIIEIVSDIEFFL